MLSTSPRSERGTVAIAALRSSEPSIRGLAAEYVASTDPALMLGSFDEHIRDPSERVRGVTWVAALELARDDAARIAIELVSDDTEPVDVRRSALVAIGTHLPTGDLVDVLALLVVHPDARLAGDAADLLFQRHRHPVVAEAARHSPHERVREIAEYLLDPLRGSPAAGGSRPGGPTRQDASSIFSDMIQRIEERAAQATGHGDELP
jgi:HEAT repeat protein